MKTSGLFFLVSIAIQTSSGCAPSERPLSTIASCTQWNTAWEHVPHRLSILELSLETRASGGADLNAQMDGGPFGEIDVPHMTYGFQVTTSTQLSALYHSTTIEIGPDSQSGEFTSEATVRLPAADLRGAHKLVAFIMGMRLSSDEYEQAPAFETDPALPYDPADGFTSQGLGISLSHPEIQDDEIVIEVAVKNSLGISDRADMNAAIPQASTWIRVDFVVIGSFTGKKGQALESKLSYFIGANEYGTNTLHPHAETSEQLVSFSGSPDGDQTLFGLTAFDFYLNLEGQHSPDCTVTQDEINSWGEPVSGPGRYIREMGFSISDTQYHPESGEGSALLDMYLTNSSEFTEVGNMCAQLTGRLAMLPFEDSQASFYSPKPVQMELVSGTPDSTFVAY